MLSVARGQLGRHDTRWFWASGQLLVRRANPYDEGAVRQTQVSVGLQRIGNDVVRNPPPALFLIVPLGFLSPTEAVAEWFLLVTACLAISIFVMRSMLLGSADYRYDKGYLILMVCFAPVLTCVASGQTGTVILLGLVLFLFFHERKPFWSGAALSLCTLKPHLFLPFGVVLLAWVALRRQWAMLGGALAALAAETGIVMLLYPAVWTHYAVAMRAQGIENLYVPTIGVALRFLLDQHAMWVEFVPAAAGCVWALWCFWRNRKQWDWRTHGSLLVLVSLVVAPYAWSTDNVIVIPAILFALLGTRLPRRGSLTLLMAAMSVAALAVIFGGVFYYKPYVVLSLLWLGWYAYAVMGRAESVARTEGVVA